MFDSKKAQELENKSHVRGKLNKEFFSSEQEELERKRKEMKYILDQQVQENKRQKEKAKYEQEKKIQDEEEKIKAYYAQVEERERRISGNSNGNSNVYENGQSNVQGISFGNKINRSGFFESRASAHENTVQRNRSRSRAQFEIEAGDIPVMPMASSPEKNSNYGFQNYNGELHNSNFVDREHRNSHKSSAGNIPLLELSQEEQKKEKKKTKRNPTKRDEKEKIMERVEKVERLVSKEKKHIATEEEINEYISSRQNTEQKEVFGELNEELEEENKELKKQLKKNKEAVSLLMGAVKSNVKFDKYRVEAEKILHGQNSLETKITPITQLDSRVKKPSTRGGHEKEEIKEKISFLPKLKLRHQSIMHDYMFGSAKKAQVKAKTFK